MRQADHVEFGFPFRGSTGDVSDGGVVAFHPHDPRAVEGCVELPGVRRGLGGAGRGSFRSGGDRAHAREFGESCLGADALGVVSCHYQDLGRCVGSDPVSTGSFRPKPSGAHPTQPGPGLQEEQRRLSAFPLPVKSPRRDPQHPAK